jgi:hypothetical protein
MRGANARSQLGVVSERAVVLLVEEQLLPDVMVSVSVGRRGSQDGGKRGHVFTTPSDSPSVIIKHAHVAFTGVKAVRSQCIQNTFTAS